MAKFTGFLLPCALALQPLAAAAQAPAAFSDAQLADSRARILKTAEALGAPVYEDYPVYAQRGPAAPPAGIAAGPASKGFQLLPPPAPEPQPAEKGNSMPMGNVPGYLRIGWHALCAQLQDSGLLFWQDKAPSFDEISDRAEAAARRSAFAPRRAGEESLLRDEGFVRELEALTGAKFLGGNSAEPLIDGPAAFAVKDRLMRGARRSVYVASYAFYDDATGAEAAEILIGRKKAGVDVKVMVDDKMAGVFGGPLLKKMEAAGIDVVRYSDADRAHDYLHVKMLVVDGETAVVGGMNYGDPYSHKGNGLKWRDTDIVYSGPAAAESARVFAALWNPRVKNPRARITPPEQNPAGAGQARIAVVPQNPPSLNPPLLTGLLKAMAGATRRINIENAYIIAIPAVNRAVIEARERGVEVNILTNSKESIDSDGKSMADTIVEGTKVFAAAGANVYLKQGETLHSKFLTVDGVFASVGSYNLHPRSERYDTECNVNILDAAAVEALDAAFAADLAAAKHMTLKDLEAKKPGWLSKLLAKVGFGQLSHKL